MITVGTARAFWRLARRTQPALCDRFEALVEAIRIGRDAEALPAVYAGMPSVNFSSGMLERAGDSLLALPMNVGLFWCDWGRPERVSATLKWLELTPAWRAKVAA